VRNKAFPRKSQVKVMSSVSAVNSLINGTTTNTPSINISSILAATSGNTAALDVTAAVAAGIYADRAPERVWQADQTTLTSQTTALTAIQTATTAVATDLASLNTLTGPLAARTVTSSGSDVTATAATGTVAGDHVVVVNSLASTGAWYSSLASSPTATLPSSSFTLTTTSGLSATIATGSGAVGDTLNDLSNAINGDGLGVTASVVSDSTGSRLAIISDTSGSAADFSISEPYTSWTAPVIPAGETLGANSLTMTSATTPATTATIATTSGENYTQLAAAINGVTPSLGVTATATTDASGNQSLAITSNNGTTPFTINEPSASGSAFSFTQATAGANASLTVDGVPVSSASNTVAGAISGVTLNLLGAAPGVPVDLTVASNAAQVSTAINQFVTDYNTAIGLVNTQFTIGSSGTEGVLASDTTVVNLQSTMEQALNYTATPATGTTTTVSTLNDLGITQNTDGTLSVDTTTLNNALTNNPGDVQNFFEGPALNGFANSMTNALTAYTEPSTGAFSVDLTGISSSSADITSQINSFETNYIANQQTVLTAEYSSAEVALQQLPAEMANIQAELGNSGSKNS
jgi:flagellar hook-associated protein 2